MNRRFTALPACLAALAIFATPVAAGSDGISAYRLEKRKISVAYRSTVTMWDCWDASARPRLSAWDGSRWVLWAVATTSVDNRKCESGQVKAVFTFQVALRGAPVAGSSFNLLRVKEHCPGCVTARWKMPINTG